MKTPVERISLRKRLALEVSRQVRENNKKLHPLRQLFWECTQRCNIHCKHCGSDCKSTAEIPDMPAADFLRVIDSLTPHVNPHEVNIIFTGGEPLVRKDLEEVGQALYHRGYPWSMVTNGLYLTDSRLQHLLKAGLHSITISLDGFADDHNWLRGHPQSYQQAMHAIRMLAREQQLTWDVVTCVNRRNYSYLEQLKDSLYEAGVRHWRLFTIFPVGRAAHYPDFQLEDKDFNGLMEFIRQTRQEGKSWPAMDAKASWEVMRQKYATAFIPAMQESAWPLFWQTAPSQPVQAFVPTILREVFTKMTSWRYGKTVFSLSGIAPG